MKKQILAYVVLALVVGLAGGCNRRSPCQKLSDQVCKSGAENECENFRRQAVGADEDTNKVCAELINLLPDRSKPSVGCDLLADMVCSERPFKDCLNMRREAFGADLKKAVVCDKFRKMIEDTRKYNQEGKSAQEDAALKAPPAQLAPKLPIDPSVPAPAPQVEEKKADGTAPAGE